MDKKILRQALKFESKNPAPSVVRDLYALASEYQNENEVFFIQAKRREKANITNKDLFFRFLADSQGVEVSCFEDLHKILNAKTRSENIMHSGDSKSNSIKVFDKTLVVKKKGSLAKIYQQKDVKLLDDIDGFLAIENAETFLNIDKMYDKFEEDYFIYLSGFANTLTREFIESKSVRFFVDYDIVSMNMYDSIKSKNKKLYVVEDIQSYFNNKKYININLYKKQIKELKSSYSKEASQIIQLIKQHNAVVEQEIIHEAS
jgi:hypothetical protein